MDISNYSANKSTLEERKRNLTNTRILYVLLALQLMLALLWTSFCVGYWGKLGEPIVRWWIFGMIAGIIAGLVMLAAFLVASIRRYPLNWAVYLAFALAFAHFWAYLCCLDGSRLLYFALWLLTSISTGFALYALSATYYMQTTGSALIVLGSSLPILFAFIAFADMGFFLVVLVYVAVVVFGVYLAFDLRKMVKNSLYDTGDDDAVTGSIKIWVEALLVFCKFAELIGAMFYKPKLMV